MMNILLQKLLILGFKGKNGLNLMEESSNFNKKNPWVGLPACPYNCKPMTPNEDRKEKTIFWQHTAWNSSRKKNLDVKILDFFIFIAA